jgi:hypothetical protein
MIILSRFGDRRQPSTVWCTAAEKSSIVTAPEPQRNVKHRPACCGLARRTDLGE